MIISIKKPDMFTLLTKKGRQIFVFRGLTVENSDLPTNNCWKRDNSNYVRISMPFDAICIRHIGLTSNLKKFSSMVDVHRRL